MNNGGGNGTTEDEDIRYVKRKILENHKMEKDLLSSQANLKISELRHELDKANERIDFLTKENAAIRSHHTNGPKPPDSPVLIVLTEAELGERILAAVKMENLKNATLEKDSTNHRISELEKKLQEKEKQIPTTIADLQTKLEKSNAAVEKLKLMWFEANARGRPGAMMYIAKDDIYRTLHPVIDGFPLPSGARQVQAVRDDNGKWIFHSTMAV